MKHVTLGVLALAAGSACSVHAAEPTEPEFHPAPSASRHITLNPRTGERLLGTPRSRYILIWDAFSVTTGFYWRQDDPSAVNPCTNAPNDRFRTEAVNSGDLPHGTTGDCFRFKYFSPDILGVGGATTIALSGFNVLISFYNNWSEAHDLLDPTSTPPTIAAGYLIKNLAANPAYSWEYSIDLLAAGPTWSFLLAGSDEDGDGADDWGWGIRWDQSQSTPRGVLGPIITDAGGSGSNAPGAESSFSRYIDAQLATPTCGYIWVGFPWADFSMGLYTYDECDVGDCDGDTICDDEELDCDGSGIPDDCEPLADCNNDREPDVCDPNHCPADLSRPWGALDILDYIAFLRHFGEEGPCADLAAPAGVFNIFDFLAFQAAFGRGC